MAQTMLNYIFVQGWPHMVPLVLTGIIFAHTFMMRFWFANPPEPPWVSAWLFQLGISGAIWCCFFIPPLIFDSEHKRSHILSGITAPIIILSICAFILLVWFIESVCEENKKRGQLRQQLQQHEIPEKYPVLYPKCKSFYSIKEIEKISSPCHVAYSWIRELKPMLDKKRCLEISCRLGMLSKAMQDVGIDIIATEKNDYSSEENADWCKIERINAVDAVRKYGTGIDYIVCTLPDPDDPDIGNALKEISKLNPKCMLLLIGCSCAGIFGCEGNRDAYEWNDYINRANQAQGWSYTQITLIDIGKYLEPNNKQTEKDL